MKKITLLLLVSAITLLPVIMVAEAKADAAAEMAKKLQNPLANIKSVMTDNTIGFNTGNDEGTSYGFQIQPVYAVDLPAHGFTFIPRAVIPVMGLEPGTRTRNVGEDGNPTPPGTSSVWGLGDSAVQLFFAPHLKSKWKWGLGPQFSLATHTDGDLKGSDWGAGAAGVVVGDVTENLSFGALVANMWSFNGEFSVMTLQPILFYNPPALPGTYIGYNAVVSSNWKADSSDRWTVPLGLSVGKTFDMGGGHGLDISAGPYKNVVRPDGAADWMIRFGI